MCHEVIVYIVDYTIIYVLEYVKFLLLQLYKYIKVDVSSISGWDFGRQNLTCTLELYLNRWHSNKV